MVHGIPRSALLRALYSVLAVALAETIGTIGIHLIEGARWVDAFYFESMLATGQGPPFPLTTDAGKIFASIMGFVSVGSVLSAVVFTIGPVVVQLWHEGVESAKQEAQTLAHGVLREVKQIEEDLAKKPDRP